MKRSRITLLVIGIVGAVMIVFLGVAGGIGYWLWNRWDTELQAARAEQEALRRSVEVAVPTSEAEADSKSVPGEIVLNVRADGSISVWGETKTKTQLKETLGAIATQHENQPVRVRGDATTPFQEIVEVIDTCQQAGIWNISFATQRPEADN